jgi:adenosylhomocysteinase
MARRKPLAGARIMGSLHMTIQTAVLIETLTDSAPTCAGCRATSSRRRITPRPRWSVGRPRQVARSGAEGHAGLRVEGRDARRVLVVHGRSARVAGRSGPTLIVDDGGDATLFVHKAAEFEKAGKVPAFNPSKEPEEWGVILTH